MVDLMVREDTITKIVICYMMGIGYKERRMVWESIFIKMRFR